MTGKRQPVASGGGERVGGARALRQRFEQRRSDGGYIGIYTPKISNRFVHVWDINTMF